MGIFRKTEKRAEEVSYDDALLKALIGSSEMDKTKALEIPSVKASINYIANVISSLPIKLYETKDGKVIEITEDKRLKLLNDDTKDTLTATQFWRAIVEDYFLGKGGYAYINKQRNEIASLNYVDERQITILKNTDPIFKEYTIQVNGKPLYPFDFVKFIRHTKDGMSGKSIIDESKIILAVAYHSLKFENNLVQKGGNKKGFLKSSKKLSDEAMTALKTAWKNLYENNAENMMVLNDGLEFQETSATSVEMQLNEKKTTNSCEISMLFGIPNAIIRGNASENDNKNFIKYCITPILNDFECSLDRDLLLEKEKGIRYFAFDTKELTRGSIKERYEAYKTAIEANFLQIDEVRAQEDLEELGLDFVRLKLGDVLYNPKTKEVYTPNTNQTANIEGGESK